MKVLIEVVRTFIFLLGRFLCSNSQSKVLYYHDVAKKNGHVYTSMTTDFEEFVKQMNVLPHYGEIVPTITRQKGQFMIAFDDGFKGVYDNKDFFLNKGIFPTIFVAKSLVGKDGYMDESQIKELSNLGFNFQSHTVSHIDMTSLGIEELRVELAVSKSYLSSLLNKDVDEICCPIGYYNEQVIEEAIKAGYKRIFLSYPSPYAVNEIVTGRYFCQSLSLFQFKLVLHGGMDILRSRYKKLHYKITS